MKTAAEWHRDLHRIVNSDPDLAFCKAMQSDIMHIQVDALTQAYKFARQQDAMEAETGTTHAHEIGEKILELIKNIRKEYHEV